MSVGRFNCALNVKMVKKGKFKRDVGNEETVLSHLWQSAASKCDSALTW